MATISNRHTWRVFSFGGDDYFQESASKAANWSGGLSIQKAVHIHHGSESFSRERDPFQHASDGV